MRKEPLFGEARGILFPRTKGTSMAFGRSRREQTPREQAPREQAPRDDEVQLADPGRVDSDPRQFVHGMLTKCGLSVVLYGPLIAEDLLRRVAQAVPVLRRSSRMAGCILQLDADPETLWTVVQGSTGAAVVLFCSPESDIPLVMEVLDRFKSLPAPLSHGLVTQGSAPRAFAAVIADAEVVPAWEIDEFRQVSPDPGYPALPASVRRAAMSWPRGPGDSYLREFVDSDGDTVTVGLAVDGYPMLIEKFGEAPTQDLSHLAPLVEQGPYELKWWDPQVMFVRAVPAGITAAELEEIAQSMCNDLALS